MDNPTEHLDPLADLACLDRFNTLFSKEVEARASYQLDKRDEELLKALASGEIDQQHRPDAIKLLAANTTAMEFLTKLLNKSG